MALALTVLVADGDDNNDNEGNAGTADTYGDAGNNGDDGGGGWDDYDAIENVHIELGVVRVNGITVLEMFSDMPLYVMPGHGGLSPTVLCRNPATGELESVGQLLDIQNHELFAPWRLRIWRTTRRDTALSCPRCSIMVDTALRPYCFGCYFPGGIFARRERHITNYHAMQCAREFANAPQDAKAFIRRYEQFCEIC